jgi:hypothetical protein
VPFSRLPGYDPVRLPSRALHTSPRISLWLSLFICLSVCPYVVLGVSFHPSACESSRACECWWLCDSAYGLYGLRCCFCRSLTFSCSCIFACLHLSQRVFLVAEVDTVNFTDTRHLSFVIYLITCFLFEASVNIRVINYVRSYTTLEPG